MCTFLVTKSVAMTIDIKPPYAGFSYLEHQIDGIQWMMMRESADALLCKGGILADDMGLGKTWQLIGLLVNAPVAHTLIVAPPVLVNQWLTALNQASIACKAYVGGKWSGPDEAQVYICSYGATKSYSSYLCGFAWDRIVLDEGQYIRNGPKTARYQALIKIQATNRWILSGTPVQNKVSDFKNLALMIGVEKSVLTRSHIKDTANIIIKRRSITLLKDKMAAPPIHVAHKLDFICKQEERKFKVLVSNVEDAIEQQFNGMVILEKYLRLHQFIAHPQIYTEAMQKKFMGYSGADWAGGASKLQKFVEILSTVEPTLVFCQFRMEMDLLASEATALGYDVCFVRGGMTEQARTAMIEASRNTVKPVILLCQINAGNCGLNLQHLTRVIFYTQHWNPSVIDQALTRSYRYGQTKQVTVHHIVLGSEELLNIDRLMLAKHKEKRECAISLMPTLKFAYHPDIYIGLKPELVVPITEEAEDPTV